MDMENGKKKILIIAIVSLVLLLFIGGFFIIKGLMLNNDENTKEVITLEVGDVESLSEYIENIDEVEKAVFGKTEVFSIDEEYMITALIEGSDSLVVTYTDGKDKKLEFESIVIEEVTIGLGEKISLSNYIENVDNIKTTSFLDGDLFALQDNYVIANHGGVDELNITYKDGTTETIRLYCNAEKIELEVGQTVNLSDYVEDVTKVKSVVVNNQSSFLVEKNTIKSLTEGNAILTVTYLDGTTELFDLICKVETSNAATSIRYRVTLDPQNGTNNKQIMNIAYKSLSSGYSIVYALNSVGSSSVRNRVVIPTKMYCSFGGYYTQTEGRGTQVITAKGVVLQSGLRTLFNQRKNTIIYAKWSCRGASTSNSYKAYKVGDAVTIDGIGYHVTKTSTANDEYVTLLRDESIGNFVFDENGGSSFETSTLKKYLTTNYKSTFGNKQLYIKDITLLEFGNYGQSSSNPLIGELKASPEGTFVYLYQNYSNTFFKFLKNAHSTSKESFWDELVIEEMLTKTSNGNFGLIAGMELYFKNRKYVGACVPFVVADGSGQGDWVCSKGATAQHAAGTFKYPVRPVVVISKKALN